jgi:hypothetical protein
LTAQPFQGVKNPFKINRLKTAFCRPCLVKAPSSTGGHSKIIGLRRSLLVTLATTLKGLVDGSIVNPTSPLGNREMSGCQKDGNPTYKLSNAPMRSTRFWIKISGRIKRQ